VPGAYGTAADGISGSRIVGHCWDTNDNNQAFLYDGTSYTTLNVPEADYSTVANGISGNNIVGFYSDTNGDIHGFLYDGASYSTLNVPGAYGTAADGISGSTIVGHCWDTNDNNQAFLYDGTNYTTLNVPEAYYGTVANGISGNNIVGFYSDANGDVHGFLLQLGCQINYTGYHQADPPPNVPRSFGFGAICDNNKSGSDSTGRPLTSWFGCALCSTAAMLTAFPNWQSTTPVFLNSLLTSLPDMRGYGSSGGSCPRNSLLNWAAIADISTNTIIPINSGSQSDGSINAYLSTNFCGYGNAVILKLQEFTNVAGSTSATSLNGTHFILVTGQTNGNDWAVFDPGWKSATPQTNLLTLSGHQRGFTSGGRQLFRQFHVAGVVTYFNGNFPVNFVAGHTDCPIELLVIDPSGRRLGYDPVAQINVFEIPDGSYIQDYPIANDSDTNGPTEGDLTGVKSFFIPSPMPGDYQIVSIGTGEGDYTNDVEISGPGVVGQSLSFSGMASVGTQSTNYVTVAMPLQISLVSNQMTVVWAVNNASGLLLETTTNLAKAWVPVTNAPVVIRNQMLVTLPITNASQFFRLSAK
jgi:hypothetical protein